MLLLFRSGSLLFFFTSLVVAVPRGVYNPDCTPAKDYGKPLWIDCIKAYMSMHDVENVRTHWADAHETSPRTEFLGLGADRQTQWPSVQTPKFYSSGTCRIAILMNGYPRAVSEVATWTDIAKAVDRIQRCPNHSGYMFKGSGRGKWPIGIHVYAISSDFSNLVMHTIVQWIENAAGGAQQQPDPLPDPSNVGDEDPEITSTDEEDEGPSSSKRPRAGPSTYCSSKDKCGPDTICGPLDLRKTSSFILGLASSVVQNVGNCVLDPFSSVATRRLGKRVGSFSDQLYGTPDNPHIGQALARPVCNVELYGRPRRADCMTAVNAMETDAVTEALIWRRQTSYSGPASWPQEEEGTHWGYLKVPRTYQCGTCIIGVNVGHNPLPDDEHDIASKAAMSSAATRMVMTCLGGGPTAALNAGGLVIAGQRKKLWITAFHVPNLPRDLAKRRSRGYANDPAVNAYLRTCDWPGGGNVKRSGISCVAPNGIDDDLDNQEPDVDVETFRKEMQQRLHELAEGYGAMYCTNDDVCGLGFGCQAVGPVGFPLLFGETMGTSGVKGICVEKS